MKEHLFSIITVPSKLSVQKVMCVPSLSFHKPAKFRDKIRANTFVGENLGMDVKVLILDVKVLVPDEADFQYATLD